MIRLRFVEVGRAKKTWEADIREGDAFEDDVFATIKEHGALGSRDIDFSYDPEERTGTIFVGMMRPVGRIEAAP